MNRNGVSISEKKNLLTIGLHIEAIDEDGNWCESEIINIIDNKIVIKFLKSKEICNRLLDIASDKWRLISNLQKINNFNINTDEFKKGDCVLARWHDGNYYLSQILDITSKTKFGTKVKEYHIVYLYDNVEETVSQNRIKSTANIDINANTERGFKDNQTMTPVNNIGKRSYRKRSINDNLESQKISDNVFYDEKTKRFTESCKIRRIRLSQASNKEKDNQDFEIKNVSIKIDKEEPIFDLPKITTPSNSSEINNFKQRFSQRKRRSSFKKADFFYPDSIDHSLNDKNKSSNNVSQVSTPVIHETFEDIPKSPKVFPVYPNQNLPEQKEYGHSSNHSPLSVSLTSTDESPKQKLKSESFQTEVEIKEYNSQGMYSCNNDGQYLCLICTNKTFRKKKLVLEHIKYYHPKECVEYSENVIQPIPKTRYSPNKRYYSSYLKSNRSSLERKKHLSKINKVKYKPYINRTLWNSSSNNISDKTFPIYQKSNIEQLIDQTGNKITENQSPIPGLGSAVKKQPSSIVYCHRCKKSNEDGCLVQCDVCLCWSHTACYGLSENKDNSNFWECDSCSNLSVNDGKKTVEWHKDRWRYHSVPQNELPWMPKPASSKIQNSLKYICEMQSLLSLSQRIIESITRHLDKLVFKGANDSNSQDDLEILKSLYVCENIDEIPRIESLDVLNTENEDIFKITCPGKSSSIICNSNEKLMSQSASNNLSNFNFNEINFANSTPIKNPVNGHKSINTSLDGILDCDIQKLDIIPKADFDALVKDLNSCEEIYKKSSCEHHSKTIFLDFIDDNCNMNHADNKHIDIPTSLDSDMPFSQSTCLYQNPETTASSEPIIDLPNDYLDNLFNEKEPQKEIVLCDDICDLTENISSIKKYSKDDSLLRNSCPEFDSKSNLIASTSSFGQLNFPRLKPIEDIQKTNPTDSKLEIEFNDLNAIIHPETANLDPGSSSGFADADMRLSPGDSKCLHWLSSKFQIVEKIIESIEAAIIKSGQSSEMSSSSSSTNADSEYSRISKYLQSLLYILKKNQN